MTEGMEGEGGGVEVCCDGDGVKLSVQVSCDADGVVWVLCW